MIEISHKQARYLIREAEDRRLPDEQWAALQAHLERCPDCRAYQRKIAGLQRELHRVLREHWGQVSGPSPDLSAQVLRQRAARGARRRRTLYALGGLLFFFIIVALQWRAQTASLASTSTAEVAAMPTLTPAPVIRYRGLMLFESHQTGDAEVFLLNSTGSTAPELSNLTNDPAQDSAPIWSPDGEWIAFLSDRSGKRELYAISVAGTRLTQLTADPDIDWQGPLSWSADGAWIALSGRRLLQNGERWGYLVPLSGSQPVSLPGTRNMAGVMKFSPSQPLLATPDRIFNLADGWSFEGWYSLKAEDSGPPAWRKAGQEFAFDWAVGGNSLAYLGWSQSDSTNPSFLDQIRLSPVIGLNNRDSLADEFSQVIDRASAASPFRSLSYLPGGPFLATLQDANDTGCWTVHLVNVYHYNLVDPTDIAGLCVDGDLERASWDPLKPQQARWLAVAGRLADPETGKPAGAPGIFAIRNSPFAPAVTPEIERLADLPAGEGTTPRIRPTGETLRIQPKAAGQDEKARVQSLPPHAVTSGILLAERNVTRTWDSIISLMRGGGADVILVPGGASNSCPTWSPDGQKIAYRSFKSGRANGIFAMDADGSSRALVAIEEEETVGGWVPTYDCPVWSPDSQLMAAVRYQGDVTRLAVIDPEEGVKATFTIDSPSRLARPVWSPDGKTIYLAGASQRISSAYLISVYPSTGPITSRILSGWDDIHAMALSPDGKQMALIAVQDSAEDRLAHANLFILDMRVQGAGLRVKLPAYHPRGVKSPGRITWLPDGRILFVQPNDPLAYDKASFVTFDPQDGAFEHLALSEDTLIDWAYRDGWLIYSSESGLWTQNIEAGLNTLPVQLSSRVITSLDLKK